MYFVEEYEIEWNILALRITSSDFKQVDVDGLKHVMLLHYYIVLYVRVSSLFHDRKSINQYDQEKVSKLLINSNIILINLIQPLNPKFVCAIFKILSNRKISTFLGASSRQF